MKAFVNQSYGSPDEVLSMQTVDRLNPIIEKIYDFPSLPAAFTHLGTRRAKGKLVIKL